MDSRERTFLALDFAEPDRVPVDLWMSSGFKRKLQAALGVSEESFRSRYDVDLRYIDGPSYVGPPLQRFPDGTEEDIWGVRRTTVEVPVPGGAETYREVAVSPLASARSAEQVNDYDHWPRPEWFDYSAIEAQCEDVRRQRRVVMFMGDRLNRIAQLKTAMYVRGIEQILVDVALNPEIAAAVFSNIRRFYLDYEERILDAARGKIDVLVMGDDFGSQNGPLLSVGMWLEFLAEGFGQYAALARSHGVRVMHHTCGGVLPLIPHMIERGLDVLQSLQPEARGMDARELKARFGGRLAFHGGISVQNVMSRGTAADVRGEVKSKVEALAPGGGYILCTAHNVQADTPVENVLALLEAYREYGRYR